MNTATRPVPRSTDVVILVDDRDQPLGTADKLKAHEDGGKLHRAFSIFVFNSQGQVMLQRRAASKYHFGGLWTNTCCSHPHPDYGLLEFARNRLQEEMGFDVPLTEQFSFVYRAHDAQSGLTEHEYDHVLFGRYDGEPHPNPAEADGWKWMEPEALRQDVVAHPERYTPWFRIVLERVLGR
ncbi:MAG: isopentenyl-diphosphate Delta-isomerase [Myxococcota bacterium]